jgi:two-component system CheB/CheR fusion protein
MAKKKANTKQKPQAQESIKDDFLIVGLGASAGGIQALQEFFRHVPADSGMAYVVILHLSPDHDSKLAEVLQQAAAIPVSQVTEKVTVKANHVYIVPPDKHLTMQERSISVSPNISIEDRRAPVDIFFRSLADSLGTQAVCVVLSGTGANGSMGLKRIKEQGGTAFVQNPREAEFNEMPRNSIATNLVDEVLRVAEIPGKIIAYSKRTSTIQIEVDPKTRDEYQELALREIFTHLRMRTGHDFTNYKRPTLLRRIERRISIRNLGDLSAYVKLLKSNADETSALLKDLLISVTNFFRDKAGYEVIEKDIIPRIIDGKSAGQQVRIWVAGCATGEEAYSLAMLCAEKTLGVIDAPKIQIFATDIDEAAVATAREGLYTINDAVDVSAERLRHFFNKEGEHYRVRREIREMILFSNHNFIKDPPFSHLDLISCRNVMIYLNNVAQERTLETFHFALNPGSFLFLGTSESVDGGSDLFATHNRDAHIYQSRQIVARSYPVPESVPTFNFGQNTNLTTQSEKKALERITFSDLHHRLLDEYAPPSLVINEENSIVHLSNSAGKYLHISGGEITQDLLKLVKDELRLELRSALYQAVQRRTAVEARGLKVKIDERIETINLHVRPVLRHDDTARGFILVLFEPVTGNEDNKEVVLSPDDPISRHLEEQLERVKSELKNSIEQHEVQKEELKASNEELQAMNEELRSAAEELETSKEELQSINEELRTVNQELKVKIEEATLSSNNIQNLINSADVATLFLDRRLRVSLFTPATRNIFNFIPSDYGRPLTDITNKLIHDGLLADAETVLKKLTVIEREVSTKDGLYYMMRVLPYRTAEDHINGVVITFYDITERRKMYEALSASEEKLRQFNASLEHEVEESRQDLFEKNQQLNHTIAQLKSFNYLASHDLREPLRKIQTYVNLIEQKKPEGKSLDTYLNSINEASKRMNQLIEDLLDYSKLSQANEGFQPVDLNAILEGVKTDYEISINEKNAVIENDALPTIDAITFQMHQLFANVIGNALKFNEGKPVIKIKARTVIGNEIKDQKGLDPKKKYAEIRISDNGIGFDNKYEEKIFEVFQRLHTQSEYKGTGIGLSIVQKIVMNHHGFIRADGEAGKGAVFTLYLPLSLEL